MTDIIFEAVAMGVDSIISGAIVSMIVLTMTLNARLNAFTSQQQTYAEAVTYYRQYSKYNQTTITSSDAIATLFYFDDNIDRIIVDVDIDPTDMCARVYERIDGRTSVYKTPITYDAGTGIYTIVAGTTFSYDNSTINYAGYDVYSAYLNGHVSTVDTSLSGSHVDISTAIDASATFKAVLLEDLQKRIDTSDALYKGGTVTRIVTVRSNVNE